MAVDAIRAMLKAEFEFDDLRAHISGDYDTLKNVVFSMLSDSKPVIKQSFDTDAQTMKLVRTD